jgi:hypothetical protein
MDAKIVYCKNIEFDRIEKNEMGGACNAYGGGKRRVQVFGGKSEKKKPLGSPGCRWEDNIKVDFQEVGGGGCGLD